MEDTEVTDTSRTVILLPIFTSATRSIGMICSGRHLARAIPGRIVPKTLTFNRDEILGAETTDYVFALVRLSKALVYFRDLSLKHSRFHSVYSQCDRASSGDCSLCLVHQSGAFLVQLSFHFHIDTNVLHS